MLEQERARPLDASDVATPRGASALAEVQRLRKLLSEQQSAIPRQAAAAAGGEQKVPEPAPLLQAGKSVRSMQTDATSKMAYPCFVVAIEDLLKMDSIECHQQLVSKGIAKEWAPGMKTFFISHQWLGGSHPDPQGQQFEVLQQIFRNFRDGKYGESIGMGMHQAGLFPALTAALANEKTVCETGKSGFIWFDYFSIPQMCWPQMEEGKAGGATMAGTLKDLGDAVASIPEYVSVCDVMLALTPWCDHADKGDVCDLRTWRERGWCRMEFQAQVMSLSSLIPGMIAPVLVAKGPNPHELAYTVPFDAFKLHVGLGTFTCCEFGHKMNGIDIPCDKVKIKSVMLDMMQRKLGHLRRKAVEAADTCLPCAPGTATPAAAAAPAEDKGEKKEGEDGEEETAAAAAAVVITKEALANQYRQYRAYREVILVGLPREENDLSKGGGVDSDDLGEFLAAYEFDVNVEEGETAEEAAKRHSLAARASGWSPLRYAVMARRTKVVETLLSLLGLTGKGEGEGEGEDAAALLREADLECPLTKADWAIFRVLGMTILHEAMATSTPAIIDLLLAAGADPLRFTVEEGIGGVFDHPFDALMMACVHARADLVEWWGQRFPEWDANRGCGEGVHASFGVMFHAAHHGGKACVDKLMKFKEHAATGDGGKGGTKLEIKWWDAVCGIINDESEPECFQVLLDAGYDPNEPNIYPPEHSMAPVLDGMIGPMVEQFKKDGSLPPMGPAFVYGSGYNAPNVLFWCATAGNLECARLMAQAGADVDAKNLFDMTHVEVAEKLGFVAYVDYFRRCPKGDGPVKEKKQAAGAAGTTKGTEEESSDARFTHAGIAAGADAGETKTSDARFTHAGLAASEVKETKE